MIISQASGDRSAMVVFVDRTECYWLQALRRGFRHCFVALQHGPSAWLICDSLKSHMELTLLNLPETFDLARHYARQGHHVLVGRTRTPDRQATVALSPLTCVSVVKRLLAIRAAHVWTPGQLFSHLLNAQPQIWRLVTVGEQFGACESQAAFMLDKLGK